MKGDMRLALALVVVLGLVGAVIATTPTILTASPDQLENSLDNVVLSWSGVATPFDGDYVAIYSPASSLKDHPTYPLGWLYLNESSTWQSGEGNLSLPLVNMRSDFAFALWGNNGTNILATSNTVTFANINEPLQGHLALTDDPSVYILMWVTAENSSVPTVEWGTSSGIYTASSSGISYTYSVDQMCSAPANSSIAWRDPGYIHEANLTALAPNTLYYYRFGSNATGWSPEYSFISTPGANPDIAVQLIAFGDMGIAPPFYSGLEQQYPSVKTAYWIAQDVAQLKAKSIPTAVLHIGDISYARGWAYLWDYFFSLIQPAATSAPYMVGIGNHEYDWFAQPYKPSWSSYGNDSGGECGVPYSQRFHMPNPAPEGAYGQRNLWYSFDYGPIHFVFASTEHNFTQGSDQWNWIVQDLTKVDRTQTPWLIFAAHRPMYTSSQHDGDVIFETYFRGAYESLFAKYHVDACLWGHVHVYERTCGMLNYECAESDNDAPIHLTIGAAGNTYNPGWITTDDGHVLQPDWVVFRTMTYGYSRIFANSTHFNLEFHGDQRNEIHDSVWLNK